MVKRLASYSLRLLFLTVVAILLGLVVVMPLVGVWDNLAYKWFISLLFVFLWCLFIWIDSQGIAQKDVQKDKIINRRVAEEGYVPSGDEGKRFQRWFGFAAGLLSQLPAVVLIVMSFSSGIMGMPSILLKGWYILFFQSFVSFEAALPYLYIVYPVLLAVVSGLAYLNGPAQQRRIETIIERNKAKKAKRVQDDLKSKKSLKKPAYRR